VAEVQKMEEIVMRKDWGQKELMGSLFLLGQYWLGKEERKSIPGIMWEEEKTTLCSHLLQA
jgi:hypothetical protein